MYSESNLRRDIVRTISPLVSPKPVIFLEQSATRPNPPYIGLKLIVHPTEVGENAHEWDNQGSEVLSGIREVTLSVNCYGQNAGEVLGNLRSRLQFQDIKDILYSKGLVLVQSSGIRDLSVLLESAYETRAQMDCIFRFVEVQSSSSSGYFESVEIENEMDGTTTVVNP